MNNLELHVEALETLEAPIDWAFWEGVAIGIAVGVAIGIAT